MNAPLRRLGVVVAMLFSMLLASTTYIQFVQADNLNSRPGNSRALEKEYGRERGPILVGGQPVVDSVKVDDDYGYQRRYRRGPEYAAVTGYYSLVYGASAMEGAADSYLSGTADQLFYRRLADLFTGRQPQGASVSLTISAKAQKAAWDALGDQRGAVVAIEPKSGKILAMVSKPSYDPNLLASHDRAKVAAAWETLTADAERPLENRAIASRLYPPGSVFKLVTAAAALSSGEYTAESQLPGPAKLKLPESTTTLPNDFSGACSRTGKVSLADALRISCNTAFGALGMTLGTEAVLSQAEDFGFDHALEIPLQVTPSSFPVDPSQAQLAQSAIGQFDVRVTPLQVAMIAAAIANGGTLMKPNLVDTINGANLDVIHREKPQKLSEPLSEDAAAALTAMMVGVVENGTGKKAQISGVSVAGKTGTAQQGEGDPPHAWFTAFAPADDPQIAIAVVVEDGGRLGTRASGGAVAAPIAKAVMQAVLRT
ncbi:MAG: penicillin-binding protein 2 [Kineosporiaceae bacterium]